MTDAVPKMARTTILIVEDEFITGADLQRRLEKAGYHVPVVADSGQKAIAFAREIRPDLVLMDISLKEEMTGVQAAQEISRTYRIPVIFLTANTDESTVDEAIRAEPFGYLTKPVDERALKTTIRMALFKHELEERLRASEEQYRTLADLLDESIYLIARDYTVTYLNTCAANLAGKDPASCIGQTIQSVLPEAIAQALVTAVGEVFRTGLPFRRTGRYDFNNTIAWLDTSIIPFHTREGEVTSVLGISRNITDRVILEQEMSRKGIFRIEKNMEQFQVLNDQIRNPLQVIAALTSLDNGPNCERIQRQVAIIDDLVARLDKGWAESTKVRSFLLRHYGHGETLRDKDYP